MSSVKLSVDDLGNMRKRWSGPKRTPGPDRPWTYLSAVATLAVAGLATIVVANRSFAPEMYYEPAAHAIGRTLAQGQNYAAFDLNVNIREIRSAQIEGLKEAPAIAIIGASHWQEAHADLSPNVKFFNAHVHRDYYDDLLAMSEVFVRNNKLPRTMVVSVRDHLFSPVEARKDHLWLPGASNYRAMAARLDIEAHSIWATLPTVRWREQISASMLFGNVTRWYNANEKPGATDQRNFATLDTLLADGSILWSAQHNGIFTPERARALALAAAATQGPTAPVIDPRGIAAVDALFGYLSKQGVEIVIAFPPFNPVYFDAVRNTPYMKGLEQVEKVAHGFAEKYNLRTIGNFDPARVGCTADMYIDSEHSNPQCLSRVLEQLGPAALPSKSWVMSAAEQPMPTNDLARQQLLILRNAQAQFGSDANTVAQAADEPRVLGSIGNGHGDPADTNLRSSAKPASRVVDGKRTRAARHAAADEKDCDCASERRRVVKRRQFSERKERSITRELVWPGDAMPEPNTRRGARLQRFSQADR